MISVKKPITVIIYVVFVHLPKAQKGFILPRQDPLTVSSVWVSKSPSHFEKLCLNLFCVSLLNLFVLFSQKRDRERSTVKNCD